MLLWLLLLLLLVVLLLRLLLQLVLMLLLLLDCGPLHRSSMGRLRWKSSQAFGDRLAGYMQ